MHMANCLWLLLALALPAAPVPEKDLAIAAHYRLRLTFSPHPRLFVSATLPSDGAALAMSASRPGNVPELAEAGWPALVRNLAVTDGKGAVVTTAPAGAGGWSLSRPVRGPLTLEYEVDYGALAARGWPAPREAAFADSSHLVAIGRSLFIITPAQGPSEVRFDLPPGWQTVAPWETGRGEPGSAVAASTFDLTENLLVLEREAPDELTAAGFHVKVVALGHWRRARHELLAALGPVLRQLVAFIGFEGRADYLIVLLPQTESGGESFRASFALTHEAPPSRDNRNEWAHTVAHEVFHYWNGWRLQGADYPSSQWFQEGFTEYAADLALVSAKLNDAADFYRQLAAHVDNYRRLATPLDAPGTHKGPPLYSGGALVAFTWDTMIREASGDRSGLAEMMRTLLRDTGGGERPYAWPDIQAALESVAPGPWAEFERRYIRGTEPLPVEVALGRIGLTLSRDEAGAARVEPDPAATAVAQSRRRALLAEVTPDRTSPPAR
jgi:predicted metalloprotease with PDZ domain